MQRTSATSFNLLDDSTMSDQNSFQWKSSRMVFDLHAFRKRICGSKQKGLRKVHLQDCLIEAQSKKQHKRVAEIKQKYNHEESK